ncbi:hypothetical protein M0811_00973 [Anaeramoeba ignava]|uniref:Uncharacterized protein n=1 Tax=Anaeramoeba ignava TaxID=1746090 RepID=A0A9Q0LL20_ANAIG|nr:hypothetical protein M0811_00973 [Anaeramoeba ignava]
MIKQNLFKIQKQNSTLNSKLNFNSKSNISNISNIEKIYKQKRINLNLKPYRNRQLEIDKENQKMIQKIREISLKKGSIDNINHSLKYSRSMNENLRKKEFDKINQENMKIAWGIISQKSTIPKKDNLIKKNLIKKNSRSNKFQKSKSKSKSNSKSKSKSKSK